MVTSRQIFLFETWGDKQYQKDKAKLSEEEIEGLENELEGFIDALRVCRHPSTDPNLRKYRPESYAGVSRLRDAQLIEYRPRGFGNRIRVIAKFPACEGSSAILLIAITISHDHDRLKRLVKGHSSDIEAWEEPEDTEG